MGHLKVFALPRGAKGSKAPRSSSQLTESLKKTPPVLGDETRYGLPVMAPKGLTLERLMEKMAVDKTLGLMLVKGRASFFFLPFFLVFFRSYFVLCWGRVDEEYVW